MIAKYQKAKLGDLDAVISYHGNAKGPVSGVVILCHGFGAPGRDLVPIAEEWYSANPDFEDVRFVFPAAPLELDPMYDARAWWEIDIERVQQLMETGEYRELRNSQPPGLAKCREMLERLIQEVCHEYGLTSQQVVVGGFSQGAMLSTDVMLHSAGSLGGLICWSGSLINEPEWQESGSPKGTAGVVQSHGESDPILPYGGAESLRELLEEKGYDVQFVTFAGQHAIPPEALQAAAELVRRVCG